MPDSGGVDAGQIVRILELLTILFFVAAGVPALGRRRHLRSAALITYSIAFAFAGVLVILWLTGLDRDISRLFHI